MQNILKAAEKIEALANSQNESDRLLLADLSPWLTKLHSMARQTLTLIEAGRVRQMERLRADHQSPLPH